MMIQPRRSQNIQNSTGRPGLGIISAENYPLYAGIYYCSGAHGTRLQRYIKGTSGQTPAAHYPTGITDSIHLGMKRGITALFPHIPAPGYDLPAPDYQGAYRRFSCCCRVNCQFQSLLHIKFIGRAKPLINSISPGIGLPFFFLCFHLQPPF